jgi:hypothetical protein
MNYFAHGCRFVGDPYFLAGTAVPDWLSIVDRRVRVRARGTQPFATDDDPRVAAVARGILQHLADDDWFHQTPAFHELNVRFTGELRQVLADDEGYRPAFLGHILVEILLDAVLIDAEPERLEGYYATLLEVDPQLVEQTVNRIAANSTDRLASLLPRFITERFLFDYLDDARLLHRLNQVMRRVNLSPLPERLLSFLPIARHAVCERKEALLREET